MYILSNGVKLTKQVCEQIRKAIKDTSGNYSYFLDMKTGKLVQVYTDNQDKLKTAQEDPQLVGLPWVTWPRKGFRRSFSSKASLNHGRLSSRVFLIFNTIYDLILMEVR